MKIDSGGYVTTIGDAAKLAADTEQAGYDAILLPETSSDALIAATAAAGTTSRIALGTGIAVAFARNPMSMAVAANDVHEYSGGRLILGLGTQIQPHITRRYSMPWSKPAARMREYVQAMRAIWTTWQDGVPLQFEGEFYRHNLMTPMFTPPAHGYGAPPVYLAGVGPKMTEIAGEVADGFLCHAFSTERYLREVTLPALHRGRAAAGETMAGFEISGPQFNVVVANEEALELAKLVVRQQLGFYGSTPAYLPVLALHGWEEAGLELHRLSVAKQWDRLGEVIDEEMLATFAVIGEADQVVTELGNRYGDVATRLSVQIPGNLDGDERADLLARLHAI